jgi:predicted nucleic acid-binding protein
MIYLDSSAALAHLLGEDRRPPDAMWDEHLASSRLLAYEMWTRANSHPQRKDLIEPLGELLARVQLSEFNATVLERMFEPLPVRLRTLDAIHLATADYLRQGGEDVEIATYDRRFADAAQAMGFELVAL